MPKLLEIDQNNLPLKLNWCLFSAAMSLGGEFLGGGREGSFASDHFHSVGT